MGTGAVYSRHDFSGGLDRRSRPYGIQGASPTALSTPHLEQLATKPFLALIVSGVRGKILLGRGNPAIFLPLETDRRENSRRMGYVLADPPW